MPTPQDYTIDQLAGLFELQQQKSLTLRTAPLSTRKANLKKLLAWIYDHRPEIQEALYKDMRKPIVEVDVSELQPVTTEIKHALANLHRWARPRKITPTLLMLGTRASIQYEPKGTCLIIAPWNFPFNLTLAPLVSALAAGNTAILKPSERTPHTAELIKNLVADIFDPAEVAVVPGAVPETQALLKLPFDHIFFTGSPQVGKIVMAAAAQNLASVTLELGGKSPAIVDETADSKDAARKLTWGKFLNCGQTCIAPDYVLVHESKQQALLQALKEDAEAYYNEQQNGIARSADYSRIVDKRHLEGLQAVLNDAVDKGATIAMGGDIKAEDNYFAPTLLTGVRPDARVLQDEIFGPILPVVRYKDLDEAIAIINSKPKPLALYVFSKSKKNINKVMRATSSGGVNINDNVLQFSHLNLPFGGVNNSGIGKSHGYYGFLAFSNEKPVLQQRIGLTGISFFYPPYTKWVKKLVEFVVKKL